MLTRCNRLLYATICVVAVAAQWLNVISASTVTDGPSIAAPAASAAANVSNVDLHETGESDESDDTTILYSDELSSVEYEDDLDVDLSARSANRPLDNDYTWDVLIFTQQWPVTTCYHWREEDKDRECALPTKNEFWTIHGIWPTKLGHIGPNFCNKTADFDVNQLQKIIDNLEQFWPDIDSEQSKLDWLWKHEWLKHGTCAAALELLDNELKYFGQGLTWRNAYLISNLLGSSGIHPDSNNTVIVLQTALVNALGKNPSIHCWYDNKSDVSYLAEIRLCFDKALQLIDCDGVKLGDTVHIDYPGGIVNTNCHVSKPVHYPSRVPPLMRERTDSWKFPVVNLYKLVQFVMWFTL